MPPVITVTHFHSLHPEYLLLHLCSCFSDEDAKAESSSENKHLDESLTQTQDRPQQPSPQPEASGSSSQVCGGGALRKPEQPDLADRSSQSSFTSQDGTGKHDEPLHTAVLDWLCASV